MGTKIQILSDLHLEFGSLEVTRTDADLVVLAGDVAPGLRGLEMARTIFPDRPVIYVAGNHEYYGQSLPALTGMLTRTAKGTNVHFLENNEVILAGVRFLGCTLWTDFNLFGPENRRAVCTLVQMAMNDYRLVEYSTARRTLRPADTRRLHLRSRAWLERKLATPFQGRTVVVTHHAPSRMSVDPLERGNFVTAAYASDLESLMHEKRVAVWVHGHTHRSLHYDLHGTLVVANQHGYSREGDVGYRPGLILEL